MKYEISVGPIGDGKIESAVYGVCPSGFGSDIRETIIRQVIDTREEQTKAALIKLGWTPPQPFPAHVKCIVKGCDNVQGLGRFVNGICAPCHSMLTTGNAGYNSTFIGDLYQKARQLDEIKFQIRKLF